MKPTIKQLQELTDLQREENERLRMQIGNLEMVQKEWHKGLQQIKKLKDELLESNEIIREQGIVMTRIVKKFVTKC